MTDMELTVLLVKQAQSTGFLFRRRALQRAMDTLPYLPWKIVIPAMAGTTRPLRWAQKLL